MFEKVTPESIGISSKAIYDFLAMLERRGATMHSIVMSRYGKIFSENYWAPFNKDSVHRMYSETKSYVAIAVGLLEEEGKISLDDKIVDYFKDCLGQTLPPFLDNLTIKDMLMMKTAGQTPGSYDAKEFYRNKLYFNHKHHSRPSNTYWEYDSNGSQILCALVEKISGKCLLDYLKEKLFNKMGTFKTAKVLKTKGGNSWGDSALVCTSRDMLSFAQLVSNYGVWEGKRLMNETYLKTATSKLTDNRMTHHKDSFHYGYGYQIWLARDDVFAFVGMGDELTICCPKKDFIFVCTADNQGEGELFRNIMTFELLEEIIDKFSDTPLSEDKENYEKLENLSKSLKLRAETGLLDSPFRAFLQDKVYVCDKNPMGITEFSFHFDDEKTGTFRYEKQGVKEIKFGVNHNEFSKFPQTGYFDDVCFEPSDTVLYDSAVSLAWYEEKKIMLSIKIIDKHLGNMSICFGFRDNAVAMYLRKTAEYFLHDYCEAQNIEATDCDARFIAKIKE